MTHDLIIIGTGSMGAAAAMHAARRGLDVLAIDRASIPNAIASHHGNTRFFRESTFEHPGYVPLLREARAAWSDLDERARIDLFERTGMLLAGPAGAESVTTSIQTCVDHDIEHEVLDHKQIQRRFPAFIVPAGYRAVWEPGAGCLACERAIEVMVGKARALGATILEHTRVTSWEADRHAVTLQTADGDHHAAALIISGGPWMSGLIDLGIDLTVTRQVQFWLEPPRRVNLPTWAFDEPTGFTFGFPPVLNDAWCKTCRHLEAAPTDPDTIDRVVSVRDLAPIRQFLQRVAPALDTPVQRSSVCMYTHSPDGAFIVDTHPEHDHIAFACGFTGHGFKFAPVVGKALVDLAIEGECDAAMRPYGLARFRD